MHLRGPSCSFAQQVAKTAEEPNLWREGLHSFATRHCGIPAHQLLPSLTVAMPHPKKQRSLKKTASFWGVLWPRQPGLGLTVPLLRVKFEGSNFFLQLFSSHFI